MKKKIFYVLMIACIGMTSIVNTSCSNQTDLVANEQQEKAGPEGVLISFGLSAEDYGTDTEVGTRGISNAQSGRVIATSTANIGNGLEVLTEVVEDNAPKTRAGSKEVPTQDYTILAYQNGQKMAEWKGRNVGRSFNLSAGQTALKHLQPGTYKFYVFNDQHMKISSEGNLTTDIGKGSRNAFYLAEDVTIQNVKQQKLELVLKPMFARVRTKLKAYIQGAFSGAFNGFSTYKQGTKYGQIINPATGVTTYTLATADGRFAYGEFENTPVEETEGENNEIKFYYVVSPKTAGNFFLEGTKLNEVSFEIPQGTGARIFGQPAGGENGVKMPNNFKGDVTLKAGKSYTLVYTMYKTADYVFSDGSAGPLVTGKKAGKTPVAIVVDATKRIAIALKNVEEQKQWSTTNSRKAVKLWPQSEQGLAECIAEYNGANSLYNGYKETWNGSNTNGNIVRADNSEFPAFNAVKDFTPVSGKSWYVPGVGDWALAFKMFGIENPEGGYVVAKERKNPWSKATTQGLGYKYQEYLFTQAGGTPLNSWYWTANQWDAGGETAITVTADAAGAFFGGAKLASKTYVRPFIKY